MRTEVMFKNAMSLLGLNVDSIKEALEVIDVLHENMIDLIIHMYNLDRKQIDVKYSGTTEEDFRMSFKLGEVAIKDWFKDTYMLVAYKRRTIFTYNPCQWVSVRERYSDFKIMTHMEFHEFKDNLDKNTTYDFIIEHHIK